MSSTNSTTNYNLSQFVGSDKPAWLADYNQDMTKIDGGIKLAQDTATGANGKATSNETKIGDLSYLATTAKNNLVAAANELKSAADTAQNTANSAVASAAAAETAVATAGKYSTTEEVAVGTWIDGKTIYRKVVDFGALPASGSKSVQHNIQNFDHYTNVSAIGLREDKTAVLIPFVSVYPNSDIQIILTSTAIEINESIDRSNTHAYITVEYTKTSS